MREVNRRRTPWLFLLTVLLVGCLGRPTEEVIILTWWLPYSPDDDVYPVFQQIAQSYTAKSGCRVRLESVPWDELRPYPGRAWSAVVTQGRHTPDVWGPVPHSWVGVFADNGQAMPLDVQMTKYLDVATRACHYKERQYCLPLLADTVALIYNKDLVPDPPKSFAELIDLAKGFNDPDRGRWGLVIPLLSPYHVYPFMEGYGGYVFACDRVSCNPADIGLNNEGSVRGVQLLSNLYRKGLLPDPLADRARTHAYAVRLFADGRAAMLIDGSWALDAVRAGNVNYGVASLPPLPDTKRRPRSLVLVDAVYVNAHSVHPAEAVALIEELTTLENISALQQALGKIPVRRDIFRRSEFRSNREMRIWREQVERGEPLPNLPEIDAVWGPWQQALEEAIPGLVPAQDALDRAVEQIRERIGVPTPRPPRG